MLCGVELSAPKDVEELTPVPADVTLFGKRVFAHNQVRMSQ